MLFALIIGCSCINKYLYLGKTNCNATGSDSYLNEELSTDEYKCSSSIPTINFDATIVDLTIIILETNKYSGLENLNQKYQSIKIQKKYDNDDYTTLFIDSQFQLEEYIIIDSLIINNDLKLNLENESPITLSFKFIHLKETTSQLNIKNIEVEKLYIFVNSNYILNDYLRNFGSTGIYFIGNGNVAITDNNQILNQKDITLYNTNLEYKGKDGYGINQVNYHGKETIKKTQDDDPQVQIHFLTLIINDQITMHEFIDADVSYFYIRALNPTILTIDPPSPIYLPISNIVNVKIVSNGKINFDEGRAFTTNQLIDITCFSGLAKDGSRLSTFYQIFSLYSLAVAFIFRHENVKINLDPAFLQFPYKTFATSSDYIVVQSSHFEGITQLNNLTVYCSDSNCQIDALLISGSGKLKTEKDVEIKPEYFTINNENNFNIYHPMKADVTNYNEFLGNFKLMKYDGDGKTQYKILYDIIAESIVLDDNINVEFDCNLYLLNDFTIPPNTNIIDSKDSGIKILKESNTLRFEKISSSYSKQSNKIYIISTFFADEFIITDDLGSKTGDFNILHFFLHLEQDVLYLSKISACKGVHLDFHIDQVYIKENTINIDKKTFSLNPKFTSSYILMMGDENKEDADFYLYVTKRFPQTIHNRKLSKLYLCGNFSLDEITATKTLFINGFMQNSGVINTHNLIIDITNSADKLAQFNIANAIYTTRIDDFSVISAIKSPKIVISGIDSNQNILIQNKIITLNKNDQSYTIDTKNHDKVILYLPHSEISSKFLAEQGNTIGLKVGDSKEKHRVIDFNIISNSEEVSNKDSLLRFTLDNSISGGNAIFDGEFGYAFDNGLNGNVVYKEGETGEDKKEKPNYFPISLVNIEPFDSDIITVPDQSSSDEISPSDEEVSSDTSSEPETSTEPDTEPEPEPIRPSKKGGGGSSGSSGGSDEQKENSMVLGNFKINTVYVGESSIIKFQPGYSFMKTARKLIGQIIPPPNYHFI